MERRELLALLGAGAAGLATGGAAKAVGDEEKKEHHVHMKTMGECALTCNMTASHCLSQLEKGGSEEQGVHAAIAAAANDCQTFCVQAVTLMARRSPMAVYAHRACADACRDCAAACEKSHDEKVRECAELCRECERLCRACCDKAA